MKKYNQFKRVKLPIKPDIKRDAGNVAFSKHMPDKTNLGTAFPGQRFKGNENEVKQK